MFKLTPISIAIFIATLVNLFVAYSSWRRRTARSGLYFAFAMSAATGWTLAAGLDYAAVPIALKVSFAKLEYLAYTSALACFTAFALSYAGYGAWLKKLWVKFLLIGLPAITTLLAWTNDWHGLIWSGFTPNPQADNVLIFHHGPAFTLIALLGYGLIFTIFVSLLAAVLKGNVLARKQARLLLWALLALVASNLIYLFDVFNIPGVDWSSIAFSITGLLFLFALYGSRFMDIVPIARTTLIERMVDGVLVLDTRGNLVDFNPAAQSILGLQLTDLWTPWSQALARWPEICAAINRPIEPHALEITLSASDAIYELSLSSLKDTRNEAYGLLIVMRDITQRKQAEASLRESEALYRQVFTAHSAVMLLVDPMSGAIVQVNDAAAQFYGYSLDALQQMNLQQIVESLTPEEIATRRQAVADGQVTYFTAPHRLAAGQVREVEVYSAPIHLEGRTLLYSIIHDVTQRQQAEAALHQRTQVLATLQQVMLDLIERHEVNDILEALLIKIGALVNAPHVSVDLLEDANTLVTYAATPDQPLKTGDAMQRGEGGWLSWQAIETGQPTLLADYSAWGQRRTLFEGFAIHAILIMPLKHGERVIGTINLLRTTSDQSFTATDLFAVEQLGRIVAVVLDNAQLMAQLRAELAERHRVEDELRIFSRAVEQSQIAVMITDTHGAIEYVNAHFTQMTGYTLAEVRGRNPRLLRSVGASPEVYRDLWTTISAGKEWRGEFQNRKKNGDLFWDATLISPIVNEQGRITHFVARKEDVTERKRAAEALLKMAAFEERQRMARDLHDSVNQSIHSLVLFAETLLVTLDRQQIDRARHIAERMQESARQALKETRLLLYQIRSPLDKSVNLIEDLEARLAMVERYAALQAQLTLVGSLDYLPPDWSDNLFWIVVEALNNALKHAQAHAVQITLRCEPHAIELDVIDDGRGFDPTRVRAGRLGLINLHNRAALIGGKLDIISAPGRGCQIHFYAEIKHVP